MESKPHPETAKSNVTPKRPLSKAVTTKPPHKAEVNSFKECITAFSRNLELKTAACEELQELFFKLANANKSLPENTDTETVNSFIAILITVISVNYGYPIALQGLSVLFTYLKGDDRVFHQFHPSKEIMLQLNIDKYLSTEGEEGKELVLDFVCFLLRYYKDVEYSDLTSDPKVLAKIRKAELERTWMDIENLAVNQENILKAAEQNQQITSNAFAELFTHVEEIKKDYESSIAELRKELRDVKSTINQKAKPTNSPAKGLGLNEASVDLPMVKRIENSFNEKVSEIRKLVDTVMVETGNLEAKQEETTKRLEETSTIVENIEKATQDMTNIINFETQLIKDNRGIMLTRISKVENEILAIVNRSSGKSENVPKAEAKEIANLRIDSIRNQIDTELLPKVNEMQVKMGSIEISLHMLKSQQKPLDSSSALLAKLDERGINGISDLIRVGMDTVSIEAKSCRKLLDTTKEQIAKLQEAQELVKNNLQNELGAKCKQLENSLSLQIESSNEHFKLTNEKMRVVTTEMENSKKHINEIITNQLKGLVLESTKYEQRVLQLEEADKRLTTQFTDLEDKMFPLEGKVSALDDVVRNTEEQMNTLLERVQLLESRPGGYSTGEPQEAREEFIKRIDQLRLQMQGYFDSSWTYIQQFADLHAVDKAKEIKVPDGNYTAKLNCLEWLVRYHEYLSGKSSLLVIEAFKETIHPSRLHERAAYASAKHSSDIMNQLLSSIRALKKGSSPEDLKQSLSDAGTYMSVLEITLVNDQNVDNAISLGIIKDLIQYILFFRSVYDPKQCAGEIKLTVRCLTYCFKNIKAVDSLIELPNGLNTVVTLIQTSKDEEIIANSIKIIRVCLRSDKQYDKVMQKVPTLFSLLIQLVSTHTYSTIILEEATAALRNYTRKIYVLDSIEDPTALAPLCKLATDKGVSKYKEFSIGALRNCCKSQKLLGYVKQTAAYEVVVKGSEDVPGMGIGTGESRYYS